MHRRLQRLLADGRQTQAGWTRLDQPEPLQERNRGVDRIRARRLEPVERTRVAPPRDDVEHRGREVDAVNLRFAVWPQSIAAVPQPANHTRGQTSGASSALLGGIGRDSFEDQSVDGAIGVVPRHLVYAAVYDGRHARHRQRCFGDVRGDDDAPRGGRSNRLVLLGGVERSVQRNDFDRTLG